jgi:hypothetical protein
LNRGGRWPVVVVVVFVVVVIVIVVVDRGSRCCSRWARLSRGSCRFGRRGQLVFVNVFVVVFVFWKKIIKNNKNLLHLLFLFCLGWEGIQFWEADNISILWIIKNKKE